MRHAAIGRRYVDKNREETKRGSPMVKDRVGRLGNGARTPERSEERADAYDEQPALNTPSIERCKEETNAGL